MARPRKARVEGSADAIRAIGIQGSAAELVAASQAQGVGFSNEDYAHLIQTRGGGTAFKVEANPTLADPVPGDNGAALARIRDYFAVSFPEDWEALKLCPLKHGLETMIERLKA